MNNETDDDADAQSAGSIGDNWDEDSLPDDAGGLEGLESETKMAFPNYTNMTFIHGFYKVMWWYCSMSFVKIEIFKVFT